MKHPVAKEEPFLRTSRESGVALIIALLAMMVLTGIGFALMVSSSTDTLIYGNFRQAGLAIYSARGGLDEMRGRMGPSTTPETNSPLTSVKIPCTLLADCPLLFDAGTGAVNVDAAYYILPDDSIDPTSNACEFRGVSCYEPDYDPAMPVPTTTTYYPTQTGAQVSYAWSKIVLATQRKLRRDLLSPCQTTNPAGAEYCDPAGLDDAQVVYWDGFSLSLTAPNPINPVFVITALAIEPGGAARYIREVAILGKLPGLPGPLTLNGFPGVYIPPTSNPFTLSGCDGATTPNPPCNEPQDVPSVVVPTAVDRAAAQALIPDGPPAGSNRNTNYPGLTNNGCQGTNCGVANPNSAAVAAADDPAVFPDGNPLTNDPYFKDCAGLAKLQAYISAFADYTYNGDTTSLPTPGSFNDDEPVVNVINGDATLAASDMRPSPSDRGFGVILVTGNLTISGSADYNGIIIVLGNVAPDDPALGGKMFVSGGGGGTIRGGIFVANTTNCPTDLGPVTFDPSGGGNFTIQYDSRYANPPDGYLPMQMLSLNY